MMKEEFLSTIDKLLDNMQRIFIIHVKKMQYFRIVEKNRKKCEQENYFLGLYKNKIENLKESLRYSVYLRIKKMTKGEILEYKKEKINEIDLKMQELKVRKTEFENIRNQLKVRQKQLRQIYSSNNNIAEKDKEKILIELKKIEEIMPQYNESNTNSIFTYIENELAKLEIKKEELKNKTSEDIKNEIINRLLVKESENNFKRLVSDAIQNGLKGGKLLSPISNDYNKVEKLNDLLKSYRDTIGDTNKYLNNITIDYSIEFGTAEKLIHSLERSSKHSVTRKSYIGLSKTIERYEKIFNEEKEKFFQNYTSEKLLPLLGIGYYEYSRNTKYKEIVNQKIEKVVDNRFLDLHSDKIDSWQVDKLNHYIKEYNIFSTKKIRTNSIKRRLIYLNNLIVNTKKQIFNEVVVWYKTQSLSVLGIDLNSILSSITEQNFENFTQEVTKKINQTEKTIKSLKDSLNKYKSLYEKTIQDSEKKQNSILDKIKKIVGYNGNVIENTIVETLDDEILNTKENKSVKSYVPNM